MADIKRCDLCGADVKNTILVRLPDENRWAKLFKKNPNNWLNHIDICFDCINEIQRIRKQRLKASEVDIEYETTDCTWK